MLAIAPTPFFGDRGCHVRIYEEVRWLAARGIETELVTFPTGRDLPDVTIRRARPWLGVSARSLGPSWGRPVLDLALLATCRRVLRTFRPHLLHGHLHEGIAIGSVLRRWSGAPLIGDLQGCLASELADHGLLAADGRMAALVTAAERWLLRRPDHILTSSEHGAGLLSRRGVARDRLTTLPDGVDVDMFRPRAPDPAQIRALGLGSKRVIVFLGVLTEYQGVDALIEAMHTVVGHRPDVHLLLMGYPNEERYRRLVRTRGLCRSITVTGRVDYRQAASRLNLGELAVGPKRSLTEANGKLLNYMACGLPTVATDTPVNRAILGDAGVYAPVGDTTALAARLLQLLSDPSAAAARGKALRRRAEEVYAWPTLIERLVALYRRTLSSSAARRARA